MMTRSITIFSVIFLGMFCVIGMGLFAPHLRERAVGRVLGNSRGTENGDKATLHENAYMKQVSQMPPISEKLRKPRKEVVAVERPMFAAPRASVAPSQPPVVIPTALAAEVREPPADAAAGPASLPASLNNKIGENATKFRTEIPGKEIKSWMSANFPAFMPKPIKSWEADILENKIKIDAKINMEELKNSLQVGSIPPMVMSLLGNEIPLYMLLQVNTINGKGEILIDDLRLSSLPISEEMKWNAMRKMLEARGLQVNDPKRLVFDLPPSIETITIKDNMLVTNEKYVAAANPVARDPNEP